MGGERDGENIQAATVNAVITTSLVRIFSAYSLRRGFALNVNIEFVHSFNNLYLFTYGCPPNQYSQRYFNESS